MRYRPSPTTGVAFVALLVVIGGVASASIPDTTGVIHACYQNNGGGLRVIDIAKRAAAGRCRKGERPLAFARQGPQGQQGAPGVQGVKGDAGPQGVKGDAGPQGPPAAGIWLRADETGHVIASSGVTSASVRVATGAYAIPVNRDVSQCASVASQDQTSGNGFIANVHVASRILPAHSSTTVFVNAFSSTGFATDTGFDVAVYC